MTTASVSASGKLYEVNLYCELTYPENPSEGERYFLGLCDYNLIFLTELDESASIDEYLDDVKKRFPKDMEEFLQENSKGFPEFVMEYIYSQEEGIHSPELDDLYIEDNHCPYANYIEGQEYDDEDDN